MACASGSRRAEKEGDQPLVRPVGLYLWLRFTDIVARRSLEIAARRFFITQGMMANKRGWCAMELAYSDLLQANLEYPGRPVLNFMLPLFFLDRADPELPRTIWG